MGYIGTLLGRTMMSKTLKGPGGGVIKSVQHGSVSWDENGGNTNVTITAVDMTKAIVTVYSKGSNGFGSAGVNAVAAKITTATNINFTRGLTGGAIAFTWQVIEYINVKSLQRGEQSVDPVVVDVGVLPDDYAVTISEINTAKSHIVNSHKTTCSSIYDSAFRMAKISSSTQISLGASSAGENTTHCWQVIEFY